VPFEWSAYARRVGLDAPPTANEDGLFRLHRAQFHSIPFENLDIQLGRGIDLAPDALGAKLIAGRRGGYCFELNGLLLMALRHLGYDTRPLLARVHLTTPPSGRTHQINAVKLGERIWLMDAGFGAGGPRQPLALEHGFEARSEYWGYRIERKHPWGWLMSSFDGGWKESYSFDFGWVTPQDIAVANYFTSHSPDTHFTRMRVVSRPTSDGRISLRNQTLTRVSNGHETLEKTPPGAATLELLEHEFGIVLPGARFEDFRPVRDD
jgi:N-hydroxyarylamine O-acetyltransferase